MKKILFLLILFSSCTFKTGGRVSQSTILELKKVYSYERLDFVVRNNHVEDSSKVRLDMIKNFLVEIVDEVEDLSDENNLTEKEIRKSIRIRLKDLRKHNVTNDEKLIIYTSLQFIYLTSSFIEQELLYEDFSKILG